MTISQKSIKILWANAAGRCAFPGCETKLCTQESGQAAPYTIGEMAHIKGEKAGSNRYDALQTPAERDDYTNLVLLCPTHHTEVDKPENVGIYSVVALLKLKADHEANVNGRLKKAKFANKSEVAVCVYPLMAENHTVFTNFGPHSEIARKNPESDAHGVWLSERLATIVPNNRKIAEVMAANKALFSPKEQEIVEKFRLHARSYERWVSDETSYEGVVRFPSEFEKLITELAHGGT
jgi:hypothetical protein